LGVFTTWSDCRDARLRELGEHAVGRAEMMRRALEAYASGPGALLLLNLARLAVVRTFDAIVWLGLGQLLEHEAETLRALVQEEAIASSVLAGMMVLERERTVARGGNGEGGEGGAGAGGEGGGAGGGGAGGGGRAYPRGQ